VIIGVRLNSLRSARTVISERSCFFSSSLSPPLRGGPWVAIHNASWELGHRRVPYAVQGSVHIPGRLIRL